jgi:hypothetical protein
MRSSSAQRAYGDNKRPIAVMQALGHNVHVQVPAQKQRGAASARVELLLLLHVCTSTAIFQAAALK